MAPQRFTARQYRQYATNWHCPGASKKKKRRHFLPQKMVDISHALGTARVPVFQDPIVLVPFFRFRASGCSPRFIEYFPESTIDVLHEA